MEEDNFVYDRKIRLQRRINKNKRLATTPGEFDFRHNGIGLFVRFDGCKIRKTLPTFDVIVCKTPIFTNFDKNRQNKCRFRSGALKHFPFMSQI